ncbi:MAG: hypothetical protein GIW99_10225 [Candidatus Eremiobacteraeota bacterium]|nr:hypothetical protein [Candidatus Eremiobacteraeota bacterium]MBC5828037.1 hypothetical protein [Candidatus Eremiobacteraeota bacterium]
MTSQRRLRVTPGEWGVCEIAINGTVVEQTIVAWEEVKLAGMPTAARKVNTIVARGLRKDDAEAIVRAMELQRSVAATIKAQRNGEKSA